MSGDVDAGADGGAHPENAQHAELESEDEHERESGHDTARVAVVALTQRSRTAHDEAGFDSLTSNRRAPEVPRYLH